MIVDVDGHDRDAIKKETSPWNRIHLADWLVLQREYELAELAELAELRTDGPADGRTDGLTDGRTRPLIEMRGRI